MTGAATVVRRLGRYTLHGPIATGGMATVHFGRLEGEGGFSRVVAIKCMRSDLAENAEFREMFLDEARLASRVRHPNVVPMLDVGSSDEGTFLVMEYVAGESVAWLLRTLARRGERVPLDIAIRIAIDTLNGLHAAHTAIGETGAALGMVHRDVSPQNILVATDGLARVLDFGIAKAAGRVTTTRQGELKGKFRYMAPEQFQDGPVTPRTDVYATSVVLWEVLTGRALFRADTDAAVFARVLEGVVPPPSSVVPDLPQELDAIVMRGLDRDPGRRFASALDMAVALEGIGPLPTPRQVSAWLEQVAGDSLRQRAAQLAEIDGTASLARVRIPPPAREPVTETRTLEMDLPPAQERSASRPRRLPGRAWMAFAGGSLVGLVGLALFAAQRMSTTAAPPPPPVPAATAESSMTVTTAERPAPVPPEPEPSATEGTPPAASAEAPASARPHPAGVNRAPSHRPAVRANCSPPWVQDSTGIRRVKPECL